MSTLFWILQFQRWIAVLQLANLLTPVPALHTIRRFSFSYKVIEWIQSVVVQINQQRLLPGFDAESLGISANSTTFVDNMRLPFHRCFLFSSGSSATWPE